MNFLKETKKAIKDSGHKFDDVMFIGSSNGAYRMSWEKFVTKANFNYDEGYGAAEIATDLIIYFKDSTYIERGEYDGSEWWEYDGSEWWEYNVPETFGANDQYKDFDILGGSNYMWKTVEEMNDSRYDENGYLKE